MGDGGGRDLAVALHAWWPKLRPGGVLAGTGWHHGARGVVETFLSTTTTTPAGAVVAEGGGEASGGGWYVTKQ